MEVGDKIEIEGNVYVLGSTEIENGPGCQVCSLHMTEHCTSKPAYHCTDVERGFWQKIEVVQNESSESTIQAESQKAEVQPDDEIIQTFTHNGVQFDLMVAKLVKPGQAIIDTLTPEKADLLHMAVGVAGEAGELLDAVKKHVVYNKPLDRENVIEELGDLNFYMERIYQLLGITREQTLAACIDKLGVRYKDGYSDKAAQERADKQ